MSNQRESTDKKQKGVIIIIVIAFVALIAALVICVVLLLSKPDNVQTMIPNDTVAAAAAALERGFVDEDSAEEVMSEMSDKVEEGMFECKMTSTWTFEDADSVSPNAYVANVENNRYTFYFDVYEESTNELLYSSPMLPVGTELKGVELEKKLSAGEYRAVVRYTLVDENYEEVSTVGFNITILVVH